MTLNIFYIVLKITHLLNCTLLCQPRNVNFLIVNVNHAKQLNVNEVTELLMSPNIIIKVTFN